MQRRVARLDKAGHGHLRRPKRLATPPGTSTLKCGDTHGELNGARGPRFPPYEEGTGAAFLNSFTPVQRVQISLRIPPPATARPHRRSNTSPLMAKPGESHPRGRVLTAWLTDRPSRPITILSRERSCPWPTGVPSITLPGEVRSCASTAAHMVSSHVYFHELSSSGGMPSWAPLGSRHKQKDKGS